MENNLSIIIQESGLEETKANFLLTNFQNYFQIADEWEKKAKSIVVLDETQKTEMEMARVGRLFLREKRIAIEKSRKQLKEQSLREGKAIDGIANVLKALIEPIEEYLDKQEHFVEIKRKEDEDRQIEEARKKVEEDERLRIEAEKKEQERIRIENEKLKLEAEQREKERLAREVEIEAERKKAEAEKEAQEKALKEAEDAKLKAEREKQEAIEAERKRSEEERQRIIDEQNRKEQERAREEKRKLEEEKAKIQAEKEEAEKLENGKKYQNFLTKNGYTEETKDQFFINRVGNEITLYKKVASIII